MRGQPFIDAVADPTRWPALTQNRRAETEARLTQQEPSVDRG
ncbi:MAG: hypothetical protein AAF626_17390 [Pseudomonadota bacterium]